MTISEVKLQNLKAQDKIYRESDGGGLFVAVLTDGSKIWRLRYQLVDKQEIVTLGKYPKYSLAKARQWRTDCAALIKLGLSPRALKRGDLTPDDIKPEAKELANAFLKNWCRAMAGKNKNKDAKTTTENTLEDFARHLDADIAEQASSKLHTVKDEQEKDVIPAIDDKQIVDVTVTEPLIVVDKDQSRSVFKRLFAYMRQKKSD